MTEYLTIKEAAAMLKVDHKTIRRGIAAGRFKAIQIGRQWRLPAEQFEAAK